MKQLLPILLVTLIVSAALAGCAGSGSGKSKDKGATPTPSPTDTPTNQTSQDDVPKFHHHNPYEGREEVLLFEDFSFQVGSTTDIAQEIKVRTEGPQKQVIVGYHEFGLADDGDDSQSTSNKADTVYQGTVKILFKFKWENPTPPVIPSADPNQAVQKIPGLRFSFSPANTPNFLPYQAPIENDVEYELPMGQRWNDLPHSIAASRWRFAVEAYDPQVADLGLPVQVHVAKGTVHVSMRMINGGDLSIDPPHPIFFYKITERYAGEINQTNLDAKTVQYPRLPDPAPQLGDYLPPLTEGSKLTGWKPGPDYIVYPETKTLKVSLYYNYTGPTKDVPTVDELIPHELGLQFKDSSGNPSLQRPVAKQTGPGFAYYELELDPQGFQWDDFYARETVWEWGVYPILKTGVEDQVDPGGDFQGNVHIVLWAEGSSDLSMTGM